jgi:DNA-binding NtrC family response regulator
LAANEQLEVWVVDDDQSVRWVLEKALRQAGMRTRSFERGEHLLDAIGKETPDVLITDVRMPGMDGLALLDRLSRMCPELPVIVVTAYIRISKTRWPHTRAVRSNTCQNLSTSTKRSISSEKQRDKAATESAGRAAATARRFRH